MSKEMNGIATREDCNSIIEDLFTTDTSKCPTKSEILATRELSIKSEGNYADNQLVRYEDIYKRYTDHSVAIDYTDLCLNKPECSQWAYTIQITNVDPCPGPINVKLKISNGENEYEVETTFSSNETGTRTFDTPDDTYEYWSLLSEPVFIVGNDRWTVKVYDPSSIEESA